MGAEGRERQERLRESPTSQSRSGGGDRDRNIVELQEIHKEGFSLQISASGFTFHLLSFSESWFISSEGTAASRGKEPSPPALGVDANFLGLGQRPARQADLAELGPQLSPRPRYAGLSPPFP